MASFVPPRQVALVLEQFPREEWARSLVNALNQFSLETVASLTLQSPFYKDLTFTTAPLVADTFPIDFPVKSRPTDVHVATVLSGVPSGAVTVLWVSSGSGTTVRISSITGLAAATAYSIRLAVL